MIRLEEGNQREELFEMWQEIFHDTIPYTQFYFDEVYGKNEILLEEDGEELRGMLHLNPYTMLMVDKEVDAHYIVGVSTKEDYRRQGIMRSLLDESFRMLRKKKEAFTYLMPADEAYYLPFSFRFGMVQYEQELEPGLVVHDEKGYTFTRAALVDPSEYVFIENEYKKGKFAMATKVDEDYLRRLDVEVKSEFGCFFYVKKEGKPMGRFVVYAEDDFLAISQMVCYEDACREEFLQQMLQFCDERYHFRQYRITYAEDWKENLLVSKQFGQIHIFQTRTHPIIMFRITDLESLAPYLKAKEEVSCILKVEDEQIADQAGYYRFVGDQNGMTIQKIAEEAPITADGSVSIDELTARIFGNLDQVDKGPKESFNEAAVSFWTNLSTLAPIEIPEIV
ncbi:MAG: GNAT family N-acetyltransferase [Eubacteriales bacterium]|nr:GNAT family N-acetyltransferase [Eubacteriales bacterium]